MVIFASALVIMVPPGGVSMAIAMAIGELWELLNTIACYHVIMLSEPITAIVTDHLFLARQDSISVFHH